jgi:hypothetical protein
MLVRDFIEVPIPLEAAVTAVVDPVLWTRALDADLDPAEQVVLARFGIQGLFGKASAPMDIRIGRPTHQPRGTIVDVQWQPGGGNEWVPVMQADVTLSALSSRLSHLEFNGCYCRSSALSSTPADRVVQHRVVEYAVRMILERVAKELLRSAVGATGQNS